MDINNLLGSFMQHKLQVFSRPYSGERSLIDDVYERLAFVDFIEKNVDALLTFLFDRKYIRSLQGYLLLSASDSLGGKIRSVRKRFCNFWNTRSIFIKQKIVLCYFPGKYENIDGWYRQIIEDKFYETYRNPFTHESRANFPPLRYETKAEMFKIRNMLKGIAFKRKDGKRVIIDTPLTMAEARLIFENAIEFFLLVEGESDKSVSIDGIERLIAYNAEYNSFQIMATDTHDYYVHNGLIKIMEMAILEACRELEGKSVDWMKESEYVI